MRNCCVSCGTNERVRLGLCDRCDDLATEEAKRRFVAWARENEATQDEEKVFDQVFAMLADG